MLFHTAEQITSLRPMYDRLEFLKTKKLGIPDLDHDETDIDDVVRLNT